MEFLLQPINRTLLEEVNENNGTMEPVRFPVAAPAEIPAPAPAGSSADAQIYRPEASCGDKAQGSEHSIEQLDPKTPGWTQRVRVGAAAPGRPPCANRITALEKTVREFADHPRDIVMVPKIGTSFDTLGEAYDFYYLYSWEKGFGIRYGKSRLNVNRSKCMQEIVCGCAGKPIVENTRSCRCECPSLIRLLRTKDNGWYIAEHRDGHNHALSQTYGQTIHWPSHKHIDVYSKDLVKQLRQNNVNLSKVYSIIGSFFGKMENVPFTKRALRNMCGKISREQAEDDVRKTMEVFHDLCSKDPQFTYRV
uniref:FAR1 domain-containing protein n=1 Tax=Aegilops tauschii subsp. strangulata TaxID=200361 RepID=A0A453AJS9_AEGTS